MGRTRRAWAPSSLPPLVLTWLALAAADGEDDLGSPAEDIAVDGVVPAAQAPHDSCERVDGRRYSGDFSHRWIGNDADAYFPILDGSPPTYVNGTQDGNFSEECAQQCTSHQDCMMWCFFAERPGIGGRCYFFGSAANQEPDDGRFIGGSCSRQGVAEPAPSTVSNSHFGAIAIAACSLLAGGLLTAVALLLCRRRRSKRMSARSLANSLHDLESCPGNHRSGRSTRTAGSGRSGSFCSRSSATPTSNLDLASDPARWGMTVQQLVGFYNDHRQVLEDYCRAHLLDDDNKHVCLCPMCPHDHGMAAHRGAAAGETAATLPQLTPTMHTVVDLLIKPSTSGQNGDLGYAPLLNSEAPLRASTFVSHCWSELFPDFVRTLEKHLPPSAAVWICSFALPQNGDINRIVSQCELEDSPFAQALMQADRVLVVVDERILPLERIWCLYEMYICAEHMIRMDVRAPTMSKSLFRGILQKVEHMDICSCQSTNESDRQRILQAVRGAESRVNNTIKQSIEELVRLMESVEE